MLDGTPTDAAVLKLGEMRLANPHHHFGHMGRAGFEERVLALPEADIVSLIGMAASAEDTRNMRLDVVAELVTGSWTPSRRPPIELDAEPRKVPADKLEFNRHPEALAHRSSARRWPTPAWCSPTSTRIATWSGGRGSQRSSTRATGRSRAGLPPGSIMSQLYERSSASGAVTDDRAVAAQAILAFLYDACDISLKRPPRGGVPHDPPRASTCPWDARCSASAARSWPSSSSHARSRTVGNDSSARRARTGTSGSRSRSPGSSPPDVPVRRRRRARAGRPHRRRVRASMILSVGSSACPRSSTSVSAPA